MREAAGITQQLDVGEGPWTLVHAAAGGTGSLLVQILAVMGAKVIGTAGSPEKCETARRNGAQWVIDNRKEDVVARVKEITSGKGVDVVFNGVGKATWDRDLEAVARKGTVIVFGNAVCEVLVCLPVNLSVWLLIFVTVRPCAPCRPSEAWGEEHQADEARVVQLHRYPRGARDIHERAV